MPISFVNSSTGTIPPSTTDDISLPVGLSENDVVFALFSCTSGNGSTELTINSSGWSKVVGETSSGGNTAIQIWWKTMGASPDSTLNVTAVLSAALAVVCMSFRGVNTTSPVVQYSTDSSFLGGMPNPPALNSISTGNWTLISGHLDDDAAAAGASHPTYLGTTASEWSGTGADMTTYAAYSSSPNTSTEDPAAFTSNTGDDAWWASSIEIAAGGYGNIVNGISSLTEVNGVEVSNITKVIGIE